MTTTTRPWFVVAAVTWLGVMVFGGQVLGWTAWRPGFETLGRLLESVVLLSDDGAELVIHVVKAGPQHLVLSP